MKVSWLRYARHADVPAWEAKGWHVVGDLGPVHGFWSVLVQWTGKGPPPR